MGVSFVIPDIAVKIQTGGYAGFETAASIFHGGGGTVAQYMANRNIATLDAGVPVLSMHAPFEVVAKVDCYEMYRACKALYEAR